MTPAELQAKVKKLTSLEVKVGWLSIEYYPESDTTVAAVAAMNEFGGARKLKNGDVVVLPARAPMRGTMNHKGNQINDAFAHQINKALGADGDVKREMNAFGLFAQGQFVETLQDGTDMVGNATATIDGMIIGHNPDGSPKRAGSSPAKENRTFGQGKGFDAPMRDTGRLSRTLIYSVENAE